LRRNELTMQIRTRYSNIRLFYLLLTFMPINSTDHPDKNPEEKPSKTKQKKAMFALQKLGEDLVDLNDKQLIALNLPEQLYDAILEARRINKFGAKQRQLQFIGKIMRRIDVTPIREKLDTWKQVSLNQIAHLHRTERWREMLLTDPNKVTEFAMKFPSADINYIRLLIRNILKEREDGGSAKHYRLLFQVIQKNLLESDTSIQRTS
jgi:ribosome-associated protein